MVKTLTRHGNSYALVIDKAILDLLDITPDSPLELTTDGRALVVAPARDAGRKRRFQAALKKTNRRYGRALRKLAEQPRMTPDFLGVDDVLRIHADQIDRYGGDDGIHDLGLLLSALAQPRATFGGRFLHGDLFDMAAAYLFHIVQDHPFVDGNKRTGAVAALVFLALNGIDVKATNDELAELVLSIAQGRTGKSAIADFFRGHRA